MHLAVTTLSLVTEKAAFSPDASKPIEKAFVFYAGSMLPSYAHTRTCDPSRHA